jgi:hypothetical protein
VTPVRWRHVCALFTAALRCAPADREVLLAAACAGDPELRSEVERLLADDREASREDFLDVPDPIGSHPDPGRPPTLRLGRAELHIVCPHCRSPIELVDRDTPSEVVCPSCGSSFHLERESTAPWSPAAATAPWAGSC